MRTTGFMPGSITPNLSMLLLLASLVGAGCSLDTGAAPDDQVSNSNTSQSDFETYRAALTEKAPGTFELDDMLLDQAHLREYFDLTHAAPNALVVRNYNSTRLIWKDPAKWDLTWCVSSGFGSNHDAIVSAMQAATKGWQTEAGAGLVFRYVGSEDGACSTSNANVRVSIVLDPTMSDAFGRSQVGPSDDGNRQYSQIRLSPLALSTWDLDVSSFGTLDLNAVLAHELGHTLGFFHEQSRPESNCYDGTWASDHESLTPYDPVSIMHYVWVQNQSCTPTNKLWLTPLDSAGARAVYPGGTPPAPVCRNRSYGRGAGTIPSCGSGQTTNAGLCYNACPAGYTGVGPVCWQNCPAGYADDGATCRRNASIIGADNSSCPWYDTCGLTLARGCSHCPSGYANDGCTCRRDASIFGKSTVTRGAGTVPSSCGSNQQLDGGLCYPTCTLGFTGVGPVCWEQCN